MPQANPESSRFREKTAPQSGSPASQARLTCIAALLGFITSDYYMVDYPEWWKQFYAGKPQNKYYGQTWSLLLPEEAYARSTPDDRPWSTKAKNIGTRFPHATSGGANEPDKRYYDAMMWTPYGDSLTLDFVKAAIEGENLGNKIIQPGCRT